MSVTPLQLWRFSDGKPGHDGQSLGLVQALAERLPVVCHDIGVLESGLGVCSILARRSRLDALAPPALLIGAGRRTYWPMLAARRVYGGRAVALMNPRGARALFDLCVIPEHDGVRAGRRVVLSKGVLNPIRLTPLNCKDAQRGLLLIGGESKHYRWHGTALLAQASAIVAHTPTVQWTLTTSRRTPQSFVHALRAAAPPSLRIAPYAETPAGWVQQRLAQSAQVWVSEDSVSMLFEALSAGAAVGVLRLLGKRDSRVVRGARRLIDEGWVTAFEAWRPGSALPMPPRPLAEADGCAQWIAQRWLQQTEILV